MDNQVKIYVLIDPITLKVRYIGRTKSTLKKRLGEHVSKSKYNYCNTHKGAWIRSLLNVNLKPIIRKLTEIDGWEESHKLERSLINKYQNRLVNHDDRGFGGLNRTYTQEQKDNISNSLKKYYKLNQIQTVTPIHSYNYDGTYFSSHASIKQASMDLNIYHGTISKHLCGITKKPSRIRMQFSYIKVDSMKNWTLV